LPGEQSLYDALGPEFTLLRLDPAVDASAMIDAAQRRGVPLAVLDVRPADAADLDGHKLLLVRPDQHIAWRGNELPLDSLALIDRVRGAI
jgi:hypothetical protein